MEILSKLFGSTAKVKIMRLFLSNPGMPYDNMMVSSKSKVKSAISRKTINTLKSIGLVKPKVFTKEVTRKKGRKNVVVKKKTHGWVVNTNFPYYNSLQNLLIQGRPTKHEDVLNKIKPAGRLKLVVAAGVFIKDPDSRLDLLIVGDRLKAGILDKGIRSLEAEIGKELDYAVFDTEEFTYRMNVYDKLIREVLEYPHEKILDKIGVYDVPSM